MPNLGESIERNYNPLVRAIINLEKPVVCAVNGIAAGAGANIALACDIAGARSAGFIQGFSKIGLVPDSGGTWTLPRLVGRARPWVWPCSATEFQRNRRSIGAWSGRRWMTTN